jgi:hypothetical protein
VKDFILASDGVHARELRATEVVAADSADPQIPTEVFVGRASRQDPANLAKLNTLVLAARAGKIARLKLADAAFTSDDPDNSNSFEFPAEEFDAFAASFTGLPFLRDHSELQSDRGGTVLKSWADPPDKDGRRWARADIELTEPWAIAGALNGTIDRFSFGAKATDKLCSICGRDFFECRDHRVGKSYEGKKARMLCKGVTGDEISAVVKPAYSGTGIGAIEIGASGRPHSLDIAAMRGDPDWKEMKGMDSKKLATLLGLAEDSTEEQIEQEIVKLKTAPGATGTIPPVILNVLDLPATATAADVTSEIMARTYRPEADVDKKEIAELRASKRVDYWTKEKGRFTPADHDWAINYALKDPEGFELYAAKKEPAVPVGGPTGLVAVPAADGDGIHADDTEEFGEGLKASDPPLTDLERKLLRKSKGIMSLKSYLKERREDAKQARRELAS